MKRMRHLAEWTLCGGLIRALLGLALFLQVLGAGVGFGMAPAMAGAAAGLSAANPDSADEAGQLILICTPDGTRLVTLPAGDAASGTVPSGAMKQGCPFCLVAAHSAGALGEPATVSLTLHPAEFTSEAAPALPPPDLLFLAADPRLHPAEPRAPPALAA